MNDDAPQRFADKKEETVTGQYEKAVDEFKSLLEDKTHPQNRTPAYRQNVISIFNRLLTAADNLEQAKPGAGVFGLIILALRSNLALKDKNIELEVRLRELEKKIRRLEKNER